MAEQTHWDVGDVVPLRATFTNPAGVETDPSTLRYDIGPPSGPVVTENVANPSALTPSSTPIARESEGVFVWNYEVDEAGYWTWRAKGTGTAAATAKGEFIVDPSEFDDNALLADRALAALAETKDYSDVTRRQDDITIVRLINAASDLIYMVSGGREFRPFAENPQARTFDLAELVYEEGPTGESRWPGVVGNAGWAPLGYARRLLPIGDLADTTDATLNLKNEDGTTLQEVALASVTALPRNRLPWLPITYLRFHSTVQHLCYGNYLEIAGNFGFPEVPGDIRQACIDTVNFWLDRPVERFQSDLNFQERDGGAPPILIGSRPAVGRRLPGKAHDIAESYNLRAKTATLTLR